MKSQTQLTMGRTAGDRTAALGAGRVGTGRLGALALVLTGLLMVVGTHSVTAKPVYVIAELLDPDQQTWVMNWDVASDGSLTQQVKKTIPLYGAGAVGLALDTKSQCLFVSYKTSNVIAVLNATTFNPVTTATAKGVNDMAGIVYDADKGLLYCAAHGRDSLYIFQWKPGASQLTPASNSPVSLEGAQAEGIALDSANGQLYVGGPSQSVLVYSTSDWHLVRTISVQRVALCVAVDSSRNHLYYGGALAGNYCLVRHDLTYDTELAVPLDPHAGVVGLAVDVQTGFVFASTGTDRPECYCGHELRSFNSDLTQIDIEAPLGVLGNPAGLVVAGGSANPLRLTKTIKTSAGDAVSATGTPQVTIGENFTYEIGFDCNDLVLSGISIVDTLPPEVSFVSATGGGKYDPSTRTCTWFNPPMSGGSLKSLELTCCVTADTAAGQPITNSVTVHTNEMPSVTTTATVITVGAKVFKPLHLTKTVTGGTTGGGNGTLPSAYAGDEVTYQITFDNNDNAYPVTNVVVTDALPAEVTFVRATGDTLFGHYDDHSRSYIWSYPQLASKESRTVGLVVQVNGTVASGTKIVNSVTITSDNNNLSTTDTAAIAITSFLPLKLQKTLSAGSVGHPDSRGRPYVNAGAQITYALTFSNPATNPTATQVVLVDTLPREVTFVSTDDSSGSYDPGTTLRAPTYTWRYSSLAPGAEKTLHLVANVNSKLDPNTVVSNSVQISSVQTAAVTAGYDVLIRAVSVTPLYLQKALSKGAVGQDKSGRALVDPGSEIVYTLTFSNPATNATVTQVTITDTLRPELTFVSADGGKLGSYNDATKTYTWVSDSLLPGVQKTLNLTVRVADKLDPNAVISNAATISANTGQVVVTSPQASVNVVVRASPVQAKDISIKPDHIYRGGTNAKSSLMVVVYMPDGIGTGAISNTPMVLTPGNVQATGQIIFGTPTQGKILGFFDAGPILSATKGTPQEYGECLVTVTGSLSGGRSFVAQGPIWIISGSGP